MPFSRVLREQRNYPLGRNIGGNYIFGEVINSSSSSSSSCGICTSSSSSSSFGYSSSSSLSSSSSESSYDLLDAYYAYGFGVDVFSSSSSE